MITKKYTFSLKNNHTTFYAPKYKSTDYSKTLDELINADIMEKNSWLNYNKNTDPINIKINTKPNDEFFNTCKFLENYNKSNNTIFIKDKIYYLSDGTPFYLTDDYITIGFDTYYYYEFGSPSLILSKMSEKMKKTIATIFIDGLKITIKK